MTRKSSCTLCARKDTQNMVKCGSCQEWQHFTCAEVTREIEGKPYQCKHCKAKVGAGGEECGATAGVHDESTDALRLCKVCYDVGMFKIKCVECKSFVHDNCAKYNSKDMVWMCSICINDESCKHMRNKGDKGKTGGYDNVDHCGVCGEGNMVDILVCIKCNDFIHRSCAVVNTLSGSICTNCVKKGEIANTKQHQPSHTAGVSGRSCGASFKEKSTSSKCESASSSRHKANLLIIEEEKRLSERRLEQQEAIDKAYLEAKRRELIAEECGSVTGNSTASTGSISRRNVLEWKQKQAKQVQWSSWRNKSFEKVEYDDDEFNDMYMLNYSDRKCNRSGMARNNLIQSRGCGTVPKRTEFAMLPKFNVLGAYGNTEFGLNASENRMPGRERNPNVPDSQRQPIRNNSRRHEVNNNDDQLYERFHRRYEPNVQQQHRLTERELASRHAQSQRSALPEFSGDPKEWPIFISAYYYSTEDCGYSDQENLIRLQKSLKGQARVDVEGLLLSPETVFEALQTLELIYGSPETIIHTQLKVLREWPVVKEDDLHGLTRLALKVRNICAIIRACRMPAHLSNPELIQETVEKLPSSLKLNWALHKLSLERAPNMTVFSDWLYTMGTAATLVTSPIVQAANESNNKSRNQSKSKGRVLVQSTRQLTPASLDNVAKGDANNKEVKRVCKSCEGNHELSLCPKFKTMDVQERWRFVVNFKLCRICFGNHLSFRCKKRRSCGINSCERKHNPLLHEESKKNDGAKPCDGSVDAHVSQNSATTSNNVQSISNATICHNRNQGDESVYFRIIPVTLYSANRSIDTYAFLDEGSSVTLMEKSLANQLQLHGPSEPLCLKWTGDTTREEIGSCRVNVEISERNNHEIKFVLNDVRTIANLDLPSQSCQAKEMCKKYNHLKELPIIPYKNAKPELLIGMNNWKVAVPISVREGNWQDPIAVKTRLGWVVCGSKSASKNQGRLNLHTCRCEHRDEKLHQMVKSFFSSESFGTKPDVKMLQSDEDIRAEHVMRSTIKFKGDHYEAGILWRIDNFTMPETIGMAERRLQCLERKMRKDANLAEDVKRQITEYQAKGYIRKMTRDEIKNPDFRAWYLPLFVVEHPFKKKRRLVWDAAAKVREVSFNSYTVPGPDIIPPLPNILFKFRQHQVAICGDLREMYHQVRIASIDKNVLRFLWRDKPTDAIEVFTADVWLFGLNCAGTVAQRVVNINAERYKNTFPEAAVAIQMSHYRDDWLGSYRTVEEALRIAKDVRYVHSQGGFEMRNWLSNSSEVLMGLNVKLHGEVKSNFMPMSLQTEKVLGMFWCPNNDEILFMLNRRRIDVNKLLGEEPPTKRIMLRTVMLVFDPIGLISFVMVLGKMLIQETWRKSVGWDESVDTEIHEKWKIWMRLLLKIEDYRIPRCYTKCRKVPNTIELHTFTDASEVAYAAVSYFRFVYDQHAEVALVTSKTRVAANKPISIPRLELLGAVLGARLASTVVESHTFKINRRYFWSDSKTVLLWLRSEARKYQSFVALRIGELLELTEADEWRWVSTKMNVADNATKWRDEYSQATIINWFQGPEFLRLNDVSWPKSDFDNEDGLTDVELRTQNSHVEIKLMPCVTVDVSHFSRWIRLLNAQIRLMRTMLWFSLLREKVNLPSGPCTSEEVKKAENTLFRKAQLDIWKNDIIKLLSGNAVDVSDQLRCLTPYLDDNGVLRSQGRIDNAAFVDDDVKRKIVLPPNHHVTRLVVAAYHERFLHQNNETVINELRQRFIILRVRQVFKSVRAGCQKCKITNAKPKPPMMGELPPARLAAYVRPFSYVGLDYFGPLEIVIGRRVEKRWVALFTCMTVRAVHLELASNLSSSSSIMCLRNFMNRRGEPVEIFSDNGTNFRGASAELIKEMKKLDNESFQSAYPGIKWSFNPPSSPHMGGVWERLVRSIKSNIVEVLPVRRPTEEVLRSFLIEVENIINSRPLTHVPVDPLDREAITPNHFILGSSSGVRTIGVPESSGDTLLNSWRKSRALANDFWHRWVMEFLPDLCRRTKWYTPAEPLKPGDLVIVIDSKNEMGRWPKAIVEEVFIGKDGQTRSARIKTSVGKYIRPTVKLAKLDIANNESRMLQSQESNTGVEDVGDRDNPDESIEPPI